MPSVDFASRLASRLGVLRARVERTDAVIDAVRQANASVEPERVAIWLVREAERWVPAPCWAVVASDAGGDLSVLADIGLSPSDGPSLWAVAHRVMRSGTEYLTADLAKDTDALGAAGTAMAFPLVCRGRTMGALIGLDPQPSSASPALGAELAAELRVVLEPVAIALDNALALKKAEALSVTDDLTLLYNSRYLGVALRRETKRAARNGRALSLLFVDMDGFKQVNDIHGHLTGSKALVEAATLIRGCARETDVVARFGGDEFAVVLPDTGHEGAYAVAARIRDRFDANRFLRQEGLALRLTASIGVATLPDVASSAEELLRAADEAMYKVKASGKNGIHVAQE